MNTFHNTLRKVTLILCLGVCVFLATVVLFSIFKKETAASTLLNTGFSFLFGKEKAVTPSLPASFTPVRIGIPSIGVDAAIQHVGLTTLGAVGAPKGPSDAGWFNLSSLPGEKGTSIIDGHSGYKNRQPAVFDDLHKLKKGNKIYVKNSAGTISVFVVRRLKSYDNDAIVPELFRSKDGGSHLNLVTCTGEWNVKDKTRSNRLVVFADLLIE